MSEIECLTKLLPEHPLSLICGKLLGDGNITIEEKRKPRFRFQHCITDKDWCEYCYFCLKDYLPLAPPKYKYTIDPRLKSGFSESFFVQSRVAEIFILLKEIWYVDRKKVLPLALISNILSAELLAWWYQDDGCLIVNNGIPKKIVLSSESFSTEENKSLIKLLFEKFLLTFSLDGQSRLCLYNQPQIYLFLHLVNPYIHPSMKRKKLQPKELDFSILPESKRTTIYLPTNIKVEKPSEFIRAIIDHIHEKEIIPLIQTPSFKKRNFPTRGYQIILHKEQLVKLLVIKSQTGLNSSQIIQFALSHSLLYN